MYLLVISYIGDIEFVKICSNQENARAELADWIQDNWHSEDTSPEDFGTDELIEWYFDNYEDYSCYREPIAVPAAAQSAMQDVLLTPGMCALVRNGLEKVDFNTANAILIDNNEWDEAHDTQETGSALIIDLIKQFE